MTDHPLAGHELSPDRGVSAVVDLCADWQARLGLRDWTVTIEPAQPFVMGLNHRSAEVQVFACTKHARIAVLPEGAYDPEALPPHDVEESLVHELLHLHLHLFDQDPTVEPKGIAMEQAINAIAHALVVAKRAEAPAVMALPFGRCPHLGGTDGNAPASQTVNGMQLCAGCLRTASLLWHSLVNPEPARTQAPA